MLAWDGSEVALRAFDVAIDITRRYQASLQAVSIAYSPAQEIEKELEYPGQIKVTVIRESRAVEYAR